MLMLTIMIKFFSNYAMFTLILCVVLSDFQVISLFAVSMSIHWSHVTDYTCPTYQWPDLYPDPGWVSS